MKRIVLLILLTPLFLAGAQGTLQYQGREGPVQLPVVANRITVMVDSSQFVSWDNLRIPAGALEWLLMSHRRVSM